MGDWDFLYEMRERGYSSEEIMDAAACGYAPYEKLYDEFDELFNDIEVDEEVFPVTYETAEEEYKAYLKEQVFHKLIENAKEYFSITGRYLQIWGELGEIYAELEFGLKRHSQFNHAGSDGFINGQLVEVKTISPEKRKDEVFVKQQGNFEQLLIVKVDKHFKFKAKLISRDKLEKFSNKLLKSKFK